MSITGNVQPGAPITISGVNWPLILAVVSGLAGVVGVVVTPIWGTHLAGEVQAVLTALSGLLTLLAGGAATVVHVTKAKLALVRNDQVARRNAGLPLAV